MPNRISDPGNDENDPSTLTARYSRALTLSYRWHREQIRKGRKTPYLAHLMSVSALVLEAGGDEELGIAGLLHDALEDAEDEDEADARREVIRREFGDRVLAAVEGCTDGTPDERKQMTWAERKKAYVAPIRNEGIADGPHRRRARERAPVAGRPSPTWTSWAEPWTPSWSSPERSGRGGSPVAPCDRGAGPRRQRKDKCA